MEKKEWRYFAIGSISVLCLVLLSCIPFATKKESRAEQAQYPETVLTALKDESSDEPEIPDSKEDIQRARETEWTTIEQEEKRYIKLPKGKLKKDVEVYLQEHYMNAQIILNIEADSEVKYDLSDVTRSFDGHTYKGEVKEKELLESMEIKRIQEKEKTRIRIILSFREIFEPVLYETEEAYYVTLAEPWNVYDKILVLDAGHGGMDEGTTSLDKKYDEKTYALMMVKKLEKKLRMHFEGRNVKIYCTRMIDMNLSKADRVGLANRLHADLLVSVHCNAAEAGEHDIKGLETLYANVPLKYGDMTSKKLAQIMLDELAKATPLEKRGIIDREGLYILRNSKVPATIVELGYMTNSSDMNFMKSEKGQDMLLNGLYKGIIKALKNK